jgi:hypothetical protein
MSVHVEEQDDDYCSYCSSMTEDCECNYCDICMEHESDCSCIVCEDCSEDKGSCTCETLMADELAANSAASVVQDPTDREVCGYCEEAACVCMHCPVCQAHWIDCDCTPCQKCHERPNHCTCCEDTTPVTPTDSAQMADLLVEYLTGRMPDYEDIHQVDTFAQAGACTMDDGVRLVWNDGTCYELTIVRR